MQSTSPTQKDIDLLFVKYKKSGSLDTRNQLFQHYNNIPSIIASRFTGRGIDLDDLVQVASMSMLKAIDRFDMNRGIKFQSFVVPTIVGEIKNYFRDYNQAIKISRRNTEAMRKMKLTINELSLELQKAPTTKQIAEKMKISEENALEILETINNVNVASIDALKNGENDSTQRDTIGDTDKGYELIENREILKQSLDVLDEKEKYVIVERFFHNRSQQAIAKKLEVSQMYVSRAEKRALQKMRSAIIK